MTIETEAALLIERQLPDAHTELAVHRIVDATPDDTFAATRSLDFLDVRTPLLDAAMWARGLPDRLGGREPDVPTLSLAALDSGDMSLPGWTVLGETPGREIAIGAVGRFWQPAIEWHTPDAGLADFTEPGWGKIATGFSLRPYGVARTLLTYDCRVATTDDESRRKFQRYWRLVRPFVGHIFRATLATIAADAERCSSPDVLTHGTRQDSDR